MLNRNYEPLDLNSRLATQQLQMVGALPADGPLYAEHLLGPTEEHKHGGMVDYEKSPALVQWIKEWGLPVNRMSIFIGRPKKVTVWHKDGDNVLCSINIPWFGLHGTATEWYNGTLTERKFLDPDTDRVMRVEGIEKNARPTERAVLANAAWAMNVNEWHRVNSMNSETLRGILSLRFPRGYSYEDLLKQLGRL